MNGFGDLFDFLAGTSNQGGLKSNKESGRKEGRGLDENSGEQYINRF